MMHSEPQTAGKAEDLQPKRWQQLDGLRFLAVSSVAWCHWAPRQLQFHLPWGTGVQLFYVLSGFLITGILLDAAPTGPGANWGARFHVWGRFYVRRFLRIFPLFYATLAITFLLGVAPILTTWKWHVTYLSNFYFFQQGDWGNPRDPFRHFWSLAVEEQFYLVWPFLVLLVSRRRLITTLVSMVVLAPLFRLGVYFFTRNAAMSHVLPFSCLDALAIGGLFACGMRQPISLRWPVARLARMVGGMGLTGAVVGAVVGRAFHDNPVADSLGHTGLVLFYGAVVFWTTQGWRGPLGALLRFKPVAYGGKISYGIYVVHLFAPLAGAAVAARLGFGNLLAASFPLQLVVNVIGTILLAVLSWHLFERPINELKRFFPYDSGPREVNPPVVLAESRRAKGVNLHGNDAKGPAVPGQVARNPYADPQS